MLAYPNEQRPIFADVPNALREKHLNAVLADFASKGILCTGETDDGALVFNLRGLIQENGSRHEGLATLFAALDSLNIAAVTLDAADVQYLWGNDMISHGMARAAESGLAGAPELLTLIGVDEIYTNLGTLQSNVINDRLPDSALQAKMNAAAAADLARAGHMTLEELEEYDRLNAAPSSDPWASMKVLPRSPNEFVDQQPWRSPFDSERD